MDLQLTGGCAISELLQFHEGRVGELIQLQVVRRHEERRHAVHRYLHRGTNKESIGCVTLPPSCLIYARTLTDTTYSIIDDFQGL